MIVVVRIHIVAETIKTSTPTRFAEATLTKFFLSQQSHFLRVFQIISMFLKFRKTSQQRSKIENPPPPIL